MFRTQAPAPFLGSSHGSGDRIRRKQQLQLKTITVVITESRSVILPLLNTKVPKQEKDRSKGHHYLQPSNIGTYVPRSSAHRPPAVPGVPSIMGQNV